MYLNHTAAAASLRLCDCRLSSRSLSARFRPAWLIIADVETFVFRELCRFPLLNYSVFVVVAGRLRVPFSLFVLDKSSRQLQEAAEHIALGSLICLVSVASHSLSN